MLVEIRDHSDRRCTACVRSEGVKAIAFGATVIVLCEECKKITQSLLQDNKMDSAGVVPDTMKNFDKRD